jgi:hypothetical protein
MTGWKKLTDTDGDVIWVNLSVAMWIQRDGNATTIAFAGGDDDVAEVTETPEEILR